LKTIITAAGDSRSRFLSAGFPAPKSLCSWKGVPIISLAMSSYKIVGSSMTVAINLEEDAEWNLGESIRTSHPDVEIIRVSSAVKGALVSALIALRDVEDSEVCIATGDSSILSGVTDAVSHFREQGTDAGTVAFKSTNPRWSYLSISPDGFVDQVAEKEVIGPLASTGFFYFRSATQFIDAAKWCLVNNVAFNGKFFVSTTLNYIISQGSNVKFWEIDRSEYVSWSNPFDFIQQSN